MNQKAEKHLANAEDYLERGDKFYRKAGLEIVAAMEADPKLSQREVGKRLGKSKDWVARVVAFATSVSPESHDLWKRGSHATAGEIEEGARNLIRKDPARVLKGMSGPELTAVSMAANQLHPATGTKIGADIGPARSYGFTMEMMGPHQKLKRAAEEYVAAWEKFGPEASEEHKQIERDLIAPVLFSLRLTVEEGSLA